MAEQKQPEFQQDIRDLTIKNIGQAHAACNQLMEAANKAQEMMKTVIPPNPVAAGISEAQERAMRFAQQNLNAAFSMANELARAKDLQEALQIQSSLCKSGHRESNILDNHRSPCLTHCPH